MRRVLSLLCGATLLASAGCAVPGGVAVEGRASQVSPPPSPPSLPSGTPVSADPVAVLRADPQIQPELKAELLPCDDGGYPIHDRYVDLTGDGTAELVVTVSACPRVLGKDGANPYPAPSVMREGFGFAAYVYDLETKPATRLLGIEDGGVEVLPIKEEVEGKPALIVIRNEWGPTDDPCCPTDEMTALYRWDGTKFVEVRR